MGLMGVALLCRPVRSLLCKMLLQETTVEDFLVQTNLKHEFVNSINGMQNDVELLRPSDATRLADHFAR